MANDVSGNPFIIDTETATTILTEARVFSVHSFAWISGSIGHIAEIKDAAGVMKIESIAGSDIFVDRGTFDPPIVFNGLKVDNLDAGTVYLYVKLLK